MVTPMESRPSDARTLDSRDAPLIDLMADAVETQNKLPSELGKTPPMAEFNVTILA